MNFEYFEDQVCVFPKCENLMKTFLRGGLAFRKSFGHNMNILMYQYYAFVPSGMMLFATQFLHHSTNFGDWLVIHVKI